MKEHNSRLHRLVQVHEPAAREERESGLHAIQQAREGKTARRDEDEESVQMTRCDAETQQQATGRLVEGHEKETFVHLEDDDFENVKYSDVLDDGIETLVKFNRKEMVLKAPANNSQNMKKANMLQHQAGAP